ncbi:MAG: hypothetical protein COT38_03900 [Candidatus Omnitrophica bacterium CG08_land_8_20_14_0_20_41_16]|uniref:TonB-dependent receptor-like beta-barrel domain-containing protein n=1 Tax=Candidatus Sherwoodlollariibacterium unditelluris TaxID=1974757 RepID=A0A2G9YK35_9BACT|nr:MAG: hypothetical protein COX41_02480 [Candidatus Omnitrophica bacterium CG23_combo_of_CG06-09_8_20_14_all_41_10]PIS33707.1 MAG: hypothetical protein COT38_03900 [Candidatus Omnitrophica bacterium CG08_land_8_20_14_0_20_41_16]
MKGLGVRLSIENRQSAGYREDTDFKKFTTSFASSLDLPQGSFDLNFGYQQKEFGAYDFYTPGQGYPSKEWTRTYLLDSGFNLNKGDLIIKPNFLWRRHFDRFVLDKRVPSYFTSNHRTDTYTPNIYFQKETGVLGKVGLGLEYGEERITSTALGRHNRGHRSIFFDDARDLTWKLSSGLSFRFDDFSGFGKVYTGSFNLRYEIVEQQFLRLGVSRSMRAPSFTELYYDDHKTTVGNSSLSSEKSLNYEAGYEIKKDKLLAGSTLFLRQENDFIDWVESNAGSNKFQAENIPGANVFGIESRLELELSENINLKTNYTYINKSVDDNGYLYKYGQNYARHLLNSELIFKLPFITQSLGFTYKQKPGRNGWFLLNSRTDYPLNKNVEVFLSITNILNLEYQEIEGIPQPGRWIEG